MNYKRLVYLSLFALFLVNLGFFLLKKLALLPEMERRDASQLRSFLQKHLSAKDQVCGESLFYYEVRSLGASFHLMDVQGTFSHTETEKSLSKPKFSHLLVSKHYLWRYPEIANSYLQDSSLQIVDSLVLPLHESKFGFATGFLSSVEIEGYNCYLYRRKSE